MIVLIVHFLPGKHSATHAKYLIKSYQMSFFFLLFNALAMRLNIDHL